MQSRALASSARPVGLGRRSISRPVSISKGTAFTRQHTGEKPSDGCRRQHRQRQPREHCPQQQRQHCRPQAIPAETYDYLAEGLELPVQLVYLTTLLGFLFVGAFVVVRQVLFKREMEEMAKDIGDRVRNQEASPEDYYELGVILLRKKLFTQANQNLKKALKNWDEEQGDGEVLAQVHNALGYSYFNLDRFEEAIKQYKMAVDMQPGYLTAWNSLGDVLEKQKKYSEALSAYQEVLGLDPSNNVAKERANWCRTRVERSQGML
jgi:tetratricopeptide (TPR) repeat protein